MQTAQHNGVQIWSSPLTRFQPTFPTYVYHADGLLIDTGPWHHKYKLRPLMQRWKPEGAVLTHHHPDHAGHASWLSKRQGVPVYASSTTIRLLARNRLTPTGVTPVEEQLETERHLFQVIPTPGHCDGHIALYEPREGWLFTGDLFVTPHPRTCMRSESMAKQMDSLRRLLKLDFGTLFCAHRGVFENGREMLYQKLSYLEDLMGQVARLRDKGMDVASIVRQLFPEKEWIERQSLGLFSRENLVRSLLEAAKQNEHQ